MIKVWSIGSEAGHTLVWRQGNLWKVRPSRRSLGNWGPIGRISEGGTRSSPPSSQAACSYSPRLLYKGQQATGLTCLVIQHRIPASCSHCLLGCCLNRPSTGHAPAGPTAEIDGSVPGQTYERPHLPGTATQQADKWLLLKEEQAKWDHMSIWCIKIIPENQARRNTRLRQGCSSLTRLP